MAAAVRRLSVLLGATLCAVLAGPVTVAGADDNALRTTFNQYAPRIAKDEQVLKHALPGYPHGRIKPLVRALNHEAADLHTLQSKLNAQSASGAGGARAKTLIVTGLGLMASAYTALRDDVRAAHGRPVPGAKVKTALSIRKRGLTKLRAGLKLLSP